MGNALNNFALGQVPQQSPGGFNLGAPQRQDFANQHMVNLGAALMSPQLQNLPNGNTILDFGGTIGRALTGAQAGTNQRVDTAHTQGMTLAEMLRREEADEQRQPLIDAQIRNLDASAERHMRPDGRAANARLAAESEMARQTQIVEGYAAMSEDDKRRNGLTDQEHSINLERMRTGIGGRAENFDSLVKMGYPGLPEPSGWDMKPTGSGLVWYNRDTLETRQTGLDIPGMANDPDITGSEYLDQVEKEFNKLMGPTPELMPLVLLMEDTEESRRLRKMWAGSEGVPARTGLGPFNREEVPAVEQNREEVQRILRERAVANAQALGFTPPPSREEVVGAGAPSAPADPDAGRPVIQPDQSAEFQGWVDNAKEAVASGMGTDQLIRIMVSKNVPESWIREIVRIATVQ